MGDFGDGRFNMRYANLTKKVTSAASGNHAAAEQFPETSHKATVGGGYTDEQLHNCNKTAL